MQSDTKRSEGNEALAASEASHVSDASSSEILFQAPLIERYPLGVLVVLGSIFLATCDLLLHGPSSCSLFRSVYIDNGAATTSMLFYTGYLAGGLGLAFASEFITKHKTIIMCSSFSILLLTIIIRYLFAETSPALCLACIFLAAFMVPFSKYVVFFDIIAQRNASLCVLSLAIGQVGKVALLAVLHDSAPFVQAVVFIICAIICIVSLLLLEYANKQVVLEDTSELLSPSDSRWAPFFGEIVLITMMAALFRATKVGGGFPDTAIGAVLEIAIYAIIVILPWHLLTKKQDRPRNKFRDAFIFMLLGLLILIGQSSSTWTLSQETAREITFFFESYALVICWTIVAAFSWTQKEKPFRMFGVAIVAWCVTSIAWLVVSSYLGNSASLVIGLVLYLSIVAASRLFPSVQVVEVKGEVPSERDLLKQMATDFKLSEREEEVFMMLAQGRSRQAIAKTLYISEGTVKTHVSNIYRKFGVSTKDALLAKVDELKN